MLRLLLLNSSIDAPWMLDAVVVAAGVEEWLPMLVLVSALVLVFAFYISASSIGCCPCHDKDVHACCALLRWVLGLSPLSLHYRCSDTPKRSSTKAISVGAHLRAHSLPHTLRLRTFDALTLVVFRLHLCCRNGTYSIFLNPSI